MDSSRASLLSSPSMITCKAFGPCTPMLSVNSTSLVRLGQGGVASADAREDADLRDEPRRPFVGPPRDFQHAAIAVSRGVASDRERDV